MKTLSESGALAPRTVAMIACRDCRNPSPSVSLTSPSSGRGSLCRNIPPGWTMLATLLIASVNATSSKYGRMFVATTRSNGGPARRSVTMSSGAACNSRAVWGLMRMILRRRPRPAPAWSGSLVPAEDPRRWKYSRYSAERLTVSLSATSLTSVRTGGCAADRRR